MHPSDLFIDSNGRINTRSSGIGEHREPALQRGGVYDTAVFTIPITTADLNGHIGNLVCRSATRSFVDDVENCRLMYRWIIERLNWCWIITKIADHNNTLRTSKRPCFPLTFQNLFFAQHSSILSRSRSKAQQPTHKLVCVEGRGEGAQAQAGADCQEEASGHRLRVESLTYFAGIKDVASAEKLFILLFILLFDTDAFSLCYCGEKVLRSS